MAANRVDQFVYILSSDGCEDIFPKNSAGDFKILLSNPISLPDDENWEVALLDIHYPCSWVNVGPKVGTDMHYTDSSGDIQVVKFPNWHCENLKEITKYIQSQLPSDEYTVELDALGRFTIKSKSTACAISMSDQLADILGFDDEAKSLLDRGRLVMQNYNKSKLDLYWKTNPLLDTNATLRKKVLEIKGDYIQLATLLKEYLNVEALKNTKIGSDAILKSGYGEKINKEIKEIAAVLECESTTELATNFAYFNHHLYKLYEDPLYPHQYVGQVGSGLHKMERFFVHTDIIEPMDINDTTSDILKVFKVKGQRYKVTQEIFNKPMYHALRKGTISLIRVYITDQFGDIVSFESGTVLVTVHFRKQKRGRVYYG
jgi:hypothetical protein